MRAACAGVGLIEVLVALLVLMVGGLGMLALQSRAVQNTQAAILQGNAVMLAHDLLEMMRSNRDAVLEMLDSFLADLAHMREAIKAGDGEAMFDLFARTRATRRGIIELGQDDARADFGRADHG